MVDQTISWTVRLIVAGVLVVASLVPSLAAEEGRRGPGASTGNCAAKDEILDFIARVWRAAAAGLPADENAAAHELGLQLIDTTDQFNQSLRTVNSGVEALDRKTSTAPDVSYRVIERGDVVWMLDVNRLSGECITLSNVRGRFGEETEVIAAQNDHAQGAGEFRYVLSGRRIKAYFVYVRGATGSYLANFSIGEYRLPSKLKR